MGKRNGLVQSLVWIICMTLLFTTTGCTSSKPKTGNGSKLELGIVSDTGKFKDRSFNQTALEGCKESEKQLGVHINPLESNRDEDYVPNLTRLARNSTDLIWAVGFKFMKAIPEVAGKFPNTKFGIIDSNLGGKIPQNVVAVTFKEEEAAFLVGVVAGLTTKTSKVGFIGGINSELIEKFRVGYIEGVKSVNPKCEITDAYADSFTDTTKGRSLASSMYNSGVDIIFHAAGGVGIGMFDEVKTREKGKCWAIGVDRDQSDLAPDHTLTSLIKRVDVAVFKITKLFKEGKFPGGKEQQLGFKENAVGIVDSKWLQPDVKKQVEEYKQKIIRGEIKVSKTKEELKG